MNNQQVLPHRTVKQQSVIRQYPTEICKVQQNPVGHRHREDQVLNTVSL